MESWRNHFLCRDLPLGKSHSGQNYWQKIWLPWADSCDIWDFEIRKYGILIICKQIPKQFLEPYWLPKQIPRWRFCKADFLLRFYANLESVLLENLLERKFGFWIWNLPALRLLGDLLEIWIFLRVGEDLFLWCNLDAPQRNLYIKIDIKWIPHQLLICSYSCL